MDKKILTPETKTTRKRKKEKCEKSSKLENYLGCLGRYSFTSHSC